LVLLPLVELGSHAGISISNSRGGATTKQDLIDRLAEGTGMSRPEVSAVVEGFLALVMDSVANGERIELRRFGIWKRGIRKGRMLRTPDGRHEVQVPDRARPIFVPAAEFNARLAERNIPDED
jgi:DNA-binding protein HU-beta